MKTVTVDVTQDIINLGTPGAADNCPVVIGIRRHTDYVPKVLNMKVEYYLDDTEPEFVTRLPTEAQRFIATFDDPTTRHLAVPFSFQIEVPDEH